MTLIPDEKCLKCPSSIFNKHELSPSIRKNNKTMTIDELNNKSQEILSVITDIKRRHSDELKPYNDNLLQLNEQFLDENLLDCAGQIVRVGMYIRHNQNMKEYEVLKRYQQCFMQYLNNPRVVVLKKDGKRTIEISGKELKEYTIIQQAEHLNSLTL